jgi:hypothetical protein
MTDAAEASISLFVYPTLIQHHPGHKMSHLTPCNSCISFYSTDRLFGPISKIKIFAIIGFGTFFDLGLSSSMQLTQIYSVYFRLNRHINSYTVRKLGLRRRMRRCMGNGYAFTIPY